MDREKIKYLADLSAVRSYASTLLNSGFSSVRKELNFLSSKIVKLDEEFIKILKEVLTEQEVSQLKTVKLTEGFSKVLPEEEKNRAVQVQSVDVPKSTAEAIESVSSIVENVVEEAIENNVPNSLVRDKELLDEALSKAKEAVKPKRSYKKVKKIADSGD
jgi:hypothetical protein